MAETVEFTEEAVKEYLDGAIRLWRQEREMAEVSEARVMFAYYIDAFQSVRTSLFGETLPPEEEDDRP